MLTFTDDALRADIAAETGFKPPYAFNAFDDLVTDVRGGIARIKSDPHLLHHDQVRGFIFDVATGRLNEVLPS
jgi:carbonic anhydrase